jgi:superfamily II DNA or RNA helicase
VKLRVTENGKYLRLYEASEVELEQVQFSLKKRIRGFFYNPLVKKKLWDGYISFFKDGYIPIGLWNEIFKLGETFNYKVEIEGLDRIIDVNFDEADFRKWCEDHFADNPKYKARDYQVDSAIAILKNRLTTSEIATSSGKTLITFLVYGYLMYKNSLNKMLVIVPNTTLVMQLNDDWEEYNNGKLPMKIRMVYGGTKDNDPSANVIVGTFHSLTRKSIEYFRGIDCICVDEAHQAKTTSIKSVLDKCKDSVIRFGLSGTMLSDNSADYFTITAYLGPMVNSISPKFLFKEGYATPIKVKIIRLDYQSTDIREKLYDLRKSKTQLDGSQLLSLEKKMVVQHKGRFNFVVNLISKTSKNSLVLFSNIKDQYGKNIYEALKDQTEKVCYYVDGGVSKEHREYYKKDMENGDNKVLVASFTTFSTGISIKNIHNIFFIESYRSEIIVKQSIGRGMRLLEGKESVNIIDIVDDLSWKKGERQNDNYLLRHGKARLEFYKQYTSDIKIHNVHL